MDKKLEARIRRLEKVLINKSVKNEATDPVATAVYKTAETIRTAVNDLCKTLAYSDIADYENVNLALVLCANSFSEDANQRFNTIIERRKSGKEYSR